MQRAIHELLHGNMKEAWNFNPGFFLFSPYWLVVLIGTIFTNLQKTNSMVRFCFRDKIIFLALIALLVWGIVRNL